MILKSRIRVYSYRQGSVSAGKLAQALGGKVLRLEGSTFSPRSGDVIVNWGNSKCPFADTTVRVLNRPEAIRLASNKLQAFLALRRAGVQCPDFAASKEDVTWSDRLTVVRHKLTGHSGEGIEIVEAGKELPDAPLYVEYIPKQDEYRVHVIGASITTIQRKARDTSVDNPNWKVRNHANGFVFVREGVTPPNLVLEQAKAAILALGLDFGAVDLVWNHQRQRAYVLEVNTAPGMEGTTVTEYRDGFLRLLGGNHEV